VLGAGPVGQSIAALARLSGAGEVIVIGAPDDRLAYARRMGATQTIGLGGGGGDNREGAKARRREDANGSAAERIDEIRRMTGGRGADVAIEASGAPEAVSHALDLPVYDTQCGAKVLRVTAATATLFDTPFRSRWIFDVELISRYLRLPVAPGEPARRDRLYELVVHAWHDRPGSKLRWQDFARAVVELGYIWRERVAHVHPKVLAAWAPDARRTSR